MTDLEKVEKLTKALQDGETLVNEHGHKLKIINGFVVGLITNGIIDFNPNIEFLHRYWKIQEPEPIFEITPNQLAEYECRDGSKAVCCGVASEIYKNYPYRVLYRYGDFDSVTINGRINISVEMPNDLVRKIRDL
jgi:hypothetical protein